MALLRTATISPDVFRNARAIRRSGTRRIHSTPSALKRTVQRAPRADRVASRRAIIEAYPIVGIVLILGYFVWALLSHIYIAQ